MLEAGTVRPERVAVAVNRRANASAAVTQGAWTLLNQLECADASIASTLFDSALRRCCCRRRGQLRGDPDCSFVAPVDAPGLRAASTLETPVRCDESVVASRPCHCVFPPMRIQQACVGRRDCAEKAVGSFCWARAASASRASVCNTCTGSSSTSMSVSRRENDYADRSARRSRTRSTNRRRELNALSISDTAAST